MTFPSDTTPMERAIVNALTEVTGQPRCLPREQLFKEGRPAELIDGPRPADVYGLCRCFLLPIEWDEIDPQLVLTDRMRIEARIELRCWYYCGDGAATPEWKRAMESIAAHCKAVTEALSYPGALATDPAGNDTGLDGYLLRPDRHKRRGPVPLIGEKFQGRVYQVTHTWATTAELARAT